MMKWGSRGNVRAGVWQKTSFDPGHLLSQRLPVRRRHMLQNRVADEQVELVVSGRDILAVIEAKVYAVVLLSRDALRLSLADIEYGYVLPGHVDAEIVPEMARPAQVAYPNAPDIRKVLQEKASSPGPEMRGHGKDDFMPETEVRHFPAPLFFRTQS